MSSIVKGLLGNKRIMNPQDSVEDYVNSLQKK